MISRQISESPPTQQGASDPISRLTGLCVYLFFPDLFPSEIKIIPLAKKKTNRVPP